MQIVVFPMRRLINKTFLLFYRYSTVAVVVGSVVGGLILLAIFIGIVAFCIMAIQKKKRMVRPTMVQPTTYNNYTGRHNISICFAA